MSKDKTDFIMRYRKKLKGMVQDLELLPVSIYFEYLLSCYSVVIVLAS